MKRVVGIGAGGHAIVAIDILLFMGELDLVGLLDSDRKLCWEKILGVPACILGSGKVND